MSLDIYSKSRNCLKKKMIAASRDLGILEDDDLKKFSAYFIKQLEKEDHFYLYRYTGSEAKYLKSLDTITLTCRGYQNDVFEGLSKCD